MGRSGGCAERVTGRIVTGDGGIKTGIGGEIRARDGNRIGITRADRTRISVAVNDEADGVTRRGIATNQTCDINGIACFCGIQNIIGSNRIDSNGCSSNSIYGMSRSSRRAIRITRRIDASNRDVKSVIDDQVRPGNGNTKRVTRTDRTRVGIAVDTKIDAIAWYSVTADGTGDVDRYPGFGGIDNIIRRYRIHGDGRTGRDIDTMSRSGGGAERVTSCIVTGNGGIKTGIGGEICACGGN